MENKLEEIIENKMNLFMITSDSRQMKPYIDAIEFILEYRIYELWKRSGRYYMDFSNLPAIKGFCTFVYGMNESCKLTLYVLVVLMNKRAPENDIRLEIPAENINDCSCKPLVDWLKKEKLLEEKIVEMGYIQENKILDLIGCRCLRKHGNVLDLYWLKFHGRLTTQRTNWLTRFRFHISLWDFRWKDPWINLTVEQDEISAEKLKPVIDWIAKRRVY